MNKSFRIVFMGTPDFAVPALKALHRSRHEVVLVVTQPDRPKGRGRKLMPTPVKAAALDCGYEVIQPEKVRTPEFIQQISAFEPDFLIVIAFGHILPEPVLNLPKIAPVNIHASLLPKYRGPAPIQWAAINGEKETGITSMLMDRGLDTGDMLLTARTEIRPEDTSGTLHDRLAEMGADVLIRTLDEFEGGTIRPVPQDHSRATYAPLLKKDDGCMDWTRPACELECLIRGVTPWPSAFTFIGERRIKVFRAETIPMETRAAPGTVVEGFEGELRVATGDGVLSLLEIQSASGKRMLVRDFLRGCKIPAGTPLSQEPDPECFLE